MTPNVCDQAASRFMQLMRRLTPARLPAVALALVLVSSLSSQALAQVVDSTMWCTDGLVIACAQSGHTLYIGGQFQRVGPVTGELVTLDPATGAAAVPYPRFLNGEVRTVIPDGSGGWYVGGNFTTALGASHVALAHMLADGSVSAWDPHVTGTSPQVYALVLDGTTLYVGGRFSGLGGQARQNIGAIDLATGLANSWSVDANDVVLAMAMNGSMLCVGGAFSTIASSSAHPALASLDKTSGTVMNWGPSVLGSLDVPRAVFSLTLQESKLYLGGSFTSVSAQSRGGAACIDVTNASLLAWDPQANATVYRIRPSGARVYLGGAFTTVSGKAHNYVAAVDANTGAASNWDPALGSAAINFVWEVLPRAGSVYVGGLFTAANGLARNCVAKLDSATAAADPGWDPSAYGAVYALVPGDNGILTGGVFNTIDRKPRSNLAAIDLSTNAATNWNPGLTGNVNALLARDARVYVGGAFHVAGGAIALNIAVLDSVTGSNVPWNVATNAAVNAFAVSGNTLYVGGLFTKFGLTEVPAHAYVGACDLVTGDVRPWNPNMNGPVDAIAATPSTVYLGGTFSLAGSAARSQLAAVDAGTGAVLPFDSHLKCLNTQGGVIRALQIRGPLLYAGGLFDSLAGQPRTNIAALDLVTGQPSPWHPVVGNSREVSDFRVYALNVGDAAVLLAGGFRTVDGVDRVGLGAVDIVTGALLDWAPRINDTVYGLAVAGGRVFAGGTFSQMGGQFHNALGACTAPGVTGPVAAFAALVSADATSSGVDLEWYAPGPVSGDCTVERRQPGMSWESIGDASPDGTERIRFQDKRVVPGADYAYRIAYNLAGTSLRSAETWVHIPDSAHFALAGATPNPASAQGVHVSFSIPVASPMRLEMFDIAGRLVGSRELRSLAAGSHTVRWDPLPSTGAGLYWLRLTQGARTATARVVITR